MMPSLMTIERREKIAEIRRDNPNILSKEIEDIIRNEVGLSHSIHRSIMRKDWSKQPHHYSMIRMLNFLGTSASKYERYNVLQLNAVYYFK